MIELNPLLALGVAMALGLLGSKLSAEIRAPQILGSVLVGLAIGPKVGRLIAPAMLEQLSLMVPLTLALIGFGIGSELKLETLRRLGRTIFLIALTESAVTFALVALGVWAVTADPREALPLALLLAALAVPTAPTTTAAMLREARAKGPVTTTILAVIGIDGLIGLLAFAVALPLAASLIASDGGGIGRFDALLDAGREVLLAAGTGIVFGWLLSLVARRMRNRGELLVTGLATLLLTAGTAELLKLSQPLLASLVAGMVLTNRNRVVANRVHESMSTFSSPVFILFFVIVGCRIEPSRIPHIGVVGVAYLIARTAAKLLGARAGASLASAAPNVRRHVGYGLLSQGGVAIALALSAQERLLATPGPGGAHLSALALTVITGSTLILFFLGPSAVKWAIGRAGEAGQARH